MVDRFENDFLDDMTYYQLKVERVHLVRSFAMHSHAFSEIVVVLSGTALHVIGEQSYEIGPGDVFVIDRLSSHAFERVKDLIIINFSYNERHLLFDKEDLRLLPGFASLFLTAPKLRERNGSVGMLRLDRPDLSFLKNIAEMILRQTSQKNEGYETVVKLLFQTVIAFLSSQYARTETTASQNLGLIADAFDYLEAHFSEELTVETLAGHLSVSPRHLERLFRQYCKETPLEHLTELRMSEALRQLAYTEAPVSEVASRCGFSDPSYFSRVFKARYQVSPRRYRELTSLKPF